MYDLDTTCGNLLVYKTNFEYYAPPRSVILAYS